MRAACLSWTYGADQVHRATLPDGRRLWACRGPRSTWYYGLTSYLGDVPNDFVCHTAAQARADAVLLASHLRVTCKPIRALRLGAWQYVYAVQPATGEGAHLHNVRLSKFGPAAPDTPGNLCVSAAGVNSPDVENKPDRSGFSRNASAEPIAEPRYRADCHATTMPMCPGAGTLAAVAAKPWRWPTDTLRTALAELHVIGTDPDHAARIVRELDERGAAPARVPVHLLLRLACPVIPRRC